MVRPRKGEKGYEQANERWHKTMEERFGDADGVHKKLQEMGRKGGLAGKGENYKGGFASDPEKARLYGRKGGRRSKRGFKFVGASGNIGEYENSETGERKTFKIKG